MKKRDAYHPDYLKIYPCLKDRPDKKCHNENTQAHLKNGLGCFHYNST